MTLFTFLQTQVLKGFNLGTRLILLLKIKILDKIHMFGVAIVTIDFRECIRNLDLRVQVHPGELWVSKQRVHIVLEASKSAGAKDDVPKICGFVHPLHPC